MSDTVHPAITDPDVRAHLARLAARAGTIPSGATDAEGDDAARIVELRANPSWVRLPDDDVIESIDTADGDLALRLYRPRAGHRGTLVFAHGGGWVAGDLDNNDALCRALAAAAGRVPEPQAGEVVASLLQAIAPPRLVREWCFTGEPFTAIEAKDAGLLNHVVPAAELDAKVDWLVGAFYADENRPLPSPGLAAGRPLVQVSLLAAAKLALRAALAALATGPTASRDIGVAPAAGASSVDGAQRSDGQTRPERTA